MLSYALLDSIADTYNPALAITYLILTIVYFFKREQAATALIYEGLLGLILTYTLLFIDKALDIWECVGLDYSTHAAFAVALIYPIVSNKVPFNKSLMITFVGYMTLMLYQGYHSLPDIVSSVIIFLAIDCIAIKIGHRLLMNNKHFSRQLND